MYGFQEVKTKANTTEWSIDFPADKYAPGKYRVELVVEKWWVMGYYKLTSERIEFEVTSKCFVVIFVILDLGVKLYKLQDF